MFVNFILSITFIMLGYLSIQRGVRMLNDNNYFFAGRGMTNFIRGQKDQEAAKARARKPYAYTQIAMGVLWIGFAGYLLYLMYMQ